MTPLLSVLLLTEDSGKHSHETLQSLVEKMLRHKDPACQAHRIDFEPPNEQAKQVVRANLWKSQKSKDYENRRRLLAAISTRISQEGGFVIFHFDGDRVWSRRESCENHQKFEEQIIKSLKEMLRRPLGDLTKERRRRGKAGTAAPRERSQEEIKHCMSRLLQVVPFYSIESWLYQNTREALRICNARYSGKDRDLFLKWEKNRAGLDEFEDPKKVCLRNKHNHELASAQFPAQEVYDLGSSFAVSTDSLRPITIHLAITCLLDLLESRGIDETRREEIRSIQDLKILNLWLDRARRKGATLEEILAPPEDEGG